MLALLKAHQIPKTVEIHAADGIERLIESLPVWLKSSELERMAVVVDADEDLSVRWTQLVAALDRGGCRGLPTVPTPEGTVLDSDGGIRVGVWVMPNNSVAGILEDFLSFLVPPGDPVLPRVDSFLKRIPVVLRRYPASRHAKARIHTWLAVQEEP